jgi:hypothetical protein
MGPTRMLSDRPITKTGAEPGNPSKTDCIRCGGRIQAGLRALGSLTCHDCRPPTQLVRAM